jgi:hypothetical protein
MKPHISVKIIYIDSMVDPMGSRTVSSKMADSIRYLKYQLEIPGRIKDGHPIVLKLYLVPLLDELPLTPALTRIQPHANAATQISQVDT